MHDVDVEAVVHGRTEGIMLKDSDAADSDTMALTSRRRRRVCGDGCWWACFCVTIVIVVIAVTVSISRATLKTNNSASLDASEQPRPTFEAVVDYLVQQGVSSMEDLTKNGSPQSKAAHFLAEQDKANLPIPSAEISDEAGYLYVTRYVMAVIYYATNGSRWKSKVNFMSGKPVCKWNGGSLAYNVDWRVERVEQGGLICKDGLPMELDLGMLNAGKVRASWRLRMPWLVRLLFCCFCSIFFYLHSCLYLALVIRIQ